MTDIALIWNAERGRGDFALAGADLQLGGQLASAVAISLFTWARARADDPLPAPDAPRQGWWGDSFAATAGDRIGSRLWLLQRETLTDDTIRRARAYAEEALAWLIEDKVAARVEVIAERQELNRLALLVRVHRTDGRAVELRFEDLWRAIND
ncbi:MAG: phage GP46 family protein [Rhodospirillales bacterium]|nr:phage GP46 family protein [Rhodospirillales bacterium]